jgi:hypothetical protein
MQQRTEPFRRQLLLIRQGVRVDVQRHLDLRVAEPRPR